MSNLPYLILVQVNPIHNIQLKSQVKHLFHLGKTNTSSPLLNVSTSLKWIIYSILRIRVLLPLYVITQHIGIGHTKSHFDRHQNN